MTKLANSGVVASAFKLCLQSFEGQRRSAAKLVENRPKCGHTVVQPGEHTGRHVSCFTRGSILCGIWCAKYHVSSEVPVKTMSSYITLWLSGIPNPMMPWWAVWRQSRSRQRHSCQRHSQHSELAPKLLAARGSLSGRFFCGPGEHDKVLQFGLYIFGYLSIFSKLLDKILL